MQANLKNAENPDFVKLKAYAKINLTLEVLKKRFDGYHELRTVMHSVGISDIVKIRKNFSGNINVSCSTRLPFNNTAYRAAAEFMKVKGCCGADIKIEKRIPERAGLGGGSADAAAVLLGMERMYGKINGAELYEIAKNIGADVSFCLKGGCALAEGAGERLTKLKPVSLNLLIVKGSGGVSTAELFHSLRLPAKSKNSAFVMKAIQNNDLTMLAENLDNALMNDAENFVPEINPLRERMLNCGALGACMTGSGSAVYGIFESAEQTEKARNAFSDCAFVQKCETAEHGCLFY